jgi:hypothetical protein
MNMNIQFAEMSVGGAVFPSSSLAGKISDGTALRPGLYVT